MPAPSKLNTPEQLLAIESQHAETIVAAGPGSGKTTVLVERILWLINVVSVPAESIVSITFTIKAAAEMERRLTARGQRIGFIGTLHSWMLNLLSTRKDHRPPLIIDEDERAQLIEGFAKRLKVRGSMASFERAITAVRARAIEAPANSDLVAKAYLNHLCQNNLLDYDGILFAGLKHLRQHAKPIGALLVDEVQDNAGVDWMIYDAVLVPWKFAVGDSDQSIYGFRGAQPHHFEERWKKCEGRLMLEKNFRCGSEIASAAQHWIEHTPRAVQKKTEAVRLGGDVSLMTCANDNDEFRVCLSFASKHSQGAILTRTNPMMLAISSFLTSFGAEIQVNDAPDRPSDWPEALALIRICIDPWNDERTLRYLQAVKMDIPDRIKLLSTPDNRPMAEYAKIIDRHENLTPRTMVSILNRRGHTESARYVSSVLPRLTDRATLQDLLLVLNRPEELTGTGCAVLTIHAAKGLEWDRVLVAGCDLEPGRAISDELRRLYFVAMTRARHGLLLTAARRREISGMTLNGDREPIDLLGAKP